MRDEVWRFFSNTVLWRWFSTVGRFCQQQLCSQLSELSALVFYTTSLVVVGDGGWGPDRKTGRQIAEWIRARLTCLSAAPLQTHLELLSCYSSLSLSVCMCAHQLSVWKRCGITMSLASVCSSVASFLSHDLNKMFQSLPGVCSVNGEPPALLSGSDLSRPAVTSEYQPEQQPAQHHIHQAACSALRNKTAAAGVQVCTQKHFSFH